MNDDFDFGVCDELEECIEVCVGNDVWCEKMDGVMIDELWRCMKMDETMIWWCNERDVSEWNGDSWNWCCFNWRWQLKNDDCGNK